MWNESNSKEKMRFTLFTLLLTRVTGGESSLHSVDRDVLKCPSEMDPECVAEALRRGRPENLMLRRGVPPGKDVTPKKIAGSDLMDSYGSFPDRFHFHKDGGKVSRRGDHTDGIAIPLILGLKLLALIGVVAVQHFLMKAALLAKLSLIVSGFLIFRAMSRSAMRYRDLLSVSPSRYPQNEPDLSGYGYTSPGGYHYNEGDLILAALNKTLMSQPGKKWRIILSEDNPFNPRGS